MCLSIEDDLMSRQQMVMHPLAVATFIFILKVFSLSGCIDLRIMLVVSFLKHNYEERNEPNQVRFQPRHGRFLVAAAENMGHTKPIYSICWDPSVEYLASVSEDSVNAWSMMSAHEGEHYCIRRKMEVVHPRGGTPEAGQQKWDIKVWSSSSLWDSIIRTLFFKLESQSKISKSVFITNFSEECTSKDLWKVCNDYGTVIDVFIPNKRSKSGKRFAFVRFIKVSNLDRLVENLNTIWMGRFHLSANRARFDRPVVSPAPKQIPGIMSRPKYVQPNAIPKEKVSSPPYLLKPSLVIDDSCLVSRDLDNCVMGEVRQVTSINNMQVLLSNEGFHNTHIVYLGGLWVMIELNSPKAKANLLQHVGVASWFSHIGNAQLDFAAKERIVWVDIEGVPLNAWSHPTFKKIGSIWGEMVDLEEENDTLFARKRICIKTSHMENILESFKLIVKGKVFWVRAKELFTWVPSFKTVPVNEVSLDDESVKANDMDNRAFDNEEESESEVVSDTVFGDYDGDQAAQDQITKMKTKKGKASKSDSSVPYPPGFTPALNVKANNKETDPVEYNHLSGKSENSNSKVLEEGEMSANSAPHVNSSAVSKSKEGGSILEILEEMITVGQTMGFLWEGVCNGHGENYWNSRRTRCFPMNCLSLNVQGLGSKAKKDWVKEMSYRHKLSFLSLQETKMENISTLDAKYLWDNFVALYGTWIPNNMKLLLISVYAPQVRSSKRSGLIDIQMEGYSFTWAHPSASKMKGIHVDDKLQFVEEPVEIMEREIKRLKRSRIPLVKVRWNSRRGPEFTWEREDSFKQKYPQLFTNRASSSTTRS
ncbi:RNA-directed DNA polymerase, eukaryota [Tanacetum coccineum]